MRLVLKVRELLVEQRTAADQRAARPCRRVRRDRRQGTSQVAPLLAARSPPTRPSRPVAKAMLALLGAADRASDAGSTLDAELLADAPGQSDQPAAGHHPGDRPDHRAHPGDDDRSRACSPSGRHLAAWLGLTPREHSTGGKHRLGRISRAGHERLRTLLVVGATAVIRHARHGAQARRALAAGSCWQRKPRKLAAVALANKMARIVWAMMTRGEAYRRPTGSAPAATAAMPAAA